MSTAANCPTFMAKLAERHEVAEHTMAFQFEKASWMGLQSWSVCRHDTVESARD
jgi:hypothetical protein